MNHEKNFERLLAAHAEMTAGRYDDARRVFEELATAGDDQAYLYLGSMHERGLGGPVDEVKASTCFSAACAGGNASACFFLGMLKFRNRDYEGAVQSYSKAADAGHPAAAYWIAQIYGDSDNPLVDQKLARHYLQMSAREGHAFAARDLAKRQMFEKKPISSKVYAFCRYVAAICKGLIIVARNVDDRRVQ